MSLPPPDGHAGALEHLPGRPRILLSNDDGVEAPGLAALADALAELGEVRIVAPDRDRSGTGHAITVHAPLEVRTTRLGGRLAYVVNGTPADCVKLGVLALFDEPPHLVVAGINAGSNLGIDVFYSGTVSVAVEGTLLGVPSLAVSALTEKARPCFDASVRVARALAEWVLRRGLPGGVWLNVNVPEPLASPLERLTWTRLGLNRRYRDTYRRIEGPDGSRHFWLMGDADEGDQEDPTTDAGAVVRGRVSVTPVHFDLTDHGALRRWGARPGQPLALQQPRTAGAAWGPRWKAEG